MSKTITFHRPITGDDHETFAARYRSAHEPLLRAHPNDGWELDLACPDQSPLGLVSMTPRPLSWWGASARWTQSAAGLPGLSPDSVTVSSWEVDEHVAWEYDRTWPDGTETPGVKFVSLVAKLPDVSDSEFRERYRAHERVAREHHGGCWRYVQNIVTGGSAHGDGDEIHAISELWFRSMDDFVTKLYTGEDSPREVAADTTAFIDFAKTSSTLVRSTVLRGVLP